MSILLMVFFFLGFICAYDCYTTQKKKALKKKQMRNLNL